MTATGDPIVDSRVADLARDRGTWVNAADRPNDCSFILPAIARSGPVTIAVSTDGTSPSLAQRLRDEVRQLLGPHVGVAARRLAGRQRGCGDANGASKAAAASQDLCPFGRVLGVLRAESLSLGFPASQAL